MKKNKMLHSHSNSPPPSYDEYPNNLPRSSISSYSNVTNPVIMNMPVYYDDSQQPPTPQHLPASQQFSSPPYFPAPQHSPVPQHSPGPQQASTMQQIAVQKTYVTNYIYQQPAQHTIEWAPATQKTASAFKHRAFVAAKNAFRVSFWIIRAHHCGDLVPGKWSTKRSIAFIPHGGKEIPVTNFEILIAEEHKVCWRSSAVGHIPSGAIAAGHTQDGEPLYIGRAKHNLFMITGKVQPSHKCCYVTHLGAEFSYKSYEVLCLM